MLLNILSTFSIHLCPVIINTLYYYPYFVYKMHLNSLIVFPKVTKQSQRFKPRFQGYIAQGGNSTPFTLSYKARN